MRKVGIIAAVVVGVIVIGLGAFLALFNPNDYRGVIQSQLEQALGRKVQLGDMSLGIFPLRFRVKNISIADDPHFGSKRPFLQAAELAVSVKLFPLLSKKVEVDSLSLERPAGELIKNPQGTWNFSTLGSNKPPSGGSTSGEVSLGELTVDDGMVAITDEQARKPRAAYDHINIALKDFSPTSAFSLKASAHLPGSGAEEISLEGKGGPLTKDPNLFPFKGSLDLKEVSIAGLEKFMQSAASGNDGSLSGHTTVANENGRAAAAGQVNIQNLKVKGTTVGFPVSLDYDLNHDLSASLLKINKSTLKLGSTPLFITGTVNGKPTPAQVDLNIKANDVSIAEAAKLASSAGIAFGAGTTVNGRLTADLQARGASDKPALNGVIKGRDLQISGKDIAQPVSVKAISLNLNPSEVRSDPFNVTSGGTTATSQFSLKQYTSENPSVDASLRAPSAALPDLLSMAKAYGVTGLEKISGAGTLAVDLHAAGPVKSLSGDEIMRTLNGTMNLNFNNVRYAGVDIAHQISSLGGFMKSGAADKGYTNILKLTGNILVKNGLAQTNNLQALLDIGNVGAVGTANLASQALNLNVTAVLNKAFSQQVGGGNLTAALANPQGEIVVPAIVTGTLQNPKFSPDVEKLAKMRLKGLMPTSDNPLGGAAGILGGLSGQPATKGTQPQNPADQIIGLFGKKKK
jgi:AsmA protein